MAYFKCAVFVKSTVVHSNVRGLHIHPPLTQWLKQSNFQSCKLCSWYTNTIVWRFPTVLCLQWWYLKQPCGSHEYSLKARAVAEMESLALDDIIGPLNQPCDHRLLALAYAAESEFPSAGSTERGTASWLQTWRVYTSLTNEAITVWSQVFPFEWGERTESHLLAFYCLLTE